MINVDLTTLSGYSTLQAGTAYNITVKALATGYQDSDPSTAVSFTKLAAPTITASDTTINWEAVENAESYDVYVDGEFYENVTGGVTTKKFTLPTYYGVTGNADGYTLLSGDIDVSESVYNALTAVNAGGSLTDFGNTCGLIIPTTQVKLDDVGYCLKATNSAEIVDGKYRATITLNSLFDEAGTNPHLIEFDYENNTATYTVIEPEYVDLEARTITVDGIKANGKTLLVYCYDEVTPETWILNNSITIDKNNPGSSGIVNFYQVGFTSGGDSWEYLGWDVMGSYTSDGSSGFGFSKTKSTSGFHVKYSSGSGWTSPTARTITFDEPVTDTTLLTWLQANGTKQ